MRKSAVKIIYTIYPIKEVHLFFIHFVSDGEVFSFKYMPICHNLFILFSFLFTIPTMFSTWFWSRYSLAHLKLQVLKNCLKSEGCWFLFGQCTFEHVHDFKYWYTHQQTDNCKILGRCLDFFLVFWEILRIKICLLSCGWDVAGGAMHGNYELSNPLRSAKAFTVPSNLSDIYLHGIHSAFKFIWHLSARHSQCLQNLSDIYLHSIHSAFKFICYSFSRSSTFGLFHRTWNFVFIN